MGLNGDLDKYGGVLKKGYPHSWMVYKFIMEIPINMDDLKVPLFQETSINDATWG